MSSHRLVGHGGYANNYRFYVTRIPFLLVAALFCCVIRGSVARDERPDSSQGTLLLVRAWDRDTGELTGWMPMHRAAITLQFMNGQVPDLKLNDAAQMRLPTHSDDSADEHVEVQIAPDAMTFSGRRWLPVEREANIVRISKARFYIKRIVFGESKRRFASIVSSQRKNDLDP